MKFITNCIRTGPAKSFDDLLRDHVGQKQVKTASVKTAEEDEAESSGQLDVEPLHQKGESTTMPKAGPSAKKEGEDAVSEEKEAEVTKNDEEGKDSGHAKWDGTNEHQNDPQVEDDAKGGSSNTETKVAGCTCGCEDCGTCGCKACTASADSQTKDNGCTCGCEDCGTCGCKACTASADSQTKDDGCTCGCEDCGTCGCKACTASDDSQTKEAGELPEALKEHQFKKKEDDTVEAKEEEKEEKEAAAIEFVKIANLDAKNKAFLRTFWTKIFPEDFVSALLADK